MDRRFPKGPPLPPPGGGQRPIYPRGMGPPPGPPMGPPAPIRPPRRRPGEEESGASERKGRCLVREDDSYKPKPSLGATGQTKRPKPEPVAHFQKSSDYRLINDIRVSKRFFWVTASALGLILIAILSIPLIPVLKSSADTKSNEVVEKPVAAAPEASSGIQTTPLRDSFQELKSAALKRIEEPQSSMEQTLAANMEITGMGEVRTFSIEGTVVSNDNEYSLNQFVKAPGQVRQVLNKDDLKMTFIYDGMLGRLEMSDFSHRQVSKQEMTSAQNLSLLMSSIPCLPAWILASNPEALSDGGQQSVDGSIYNVVRNRCSPPYEILHYFDLETNLERFRRATVEQDGQPLSIEVSFSDYKQTDQFYAPMQIEVNEQTHSLNQSTTTIKKCHFNQGLLPSLFSLDNS